jgi:hypothetical protein
VRRLRVAKFAAAVCGHRQSRLRRHVGGRLAFVPLRHRERLGKLLQQINFNEPEHV